VHKKGGPLLGPLLERTNLEYLKVLINFTGLNLQRLYLAWLIFPRGGLDAPGLCRLYLAPERDREDSDVLSIPLEFAQLLLFLLLFLGQEFIVFLAVFI
jgi:hypothetical protein